MHLSSLPARFRPYLVALVGLERAHQQNHPYAVLYPDLIQPFIVVSTIDHPNLEWGVHDVPGTAAGLELRGLLVRHHPGTLPGPDTMRVSSTVAGRYLVDHP